MPSHVIPSRLLQHQIPGLSDLQQVLLGVYLRSTNALWVASCGSPEYNPLLAAYDHFANAFLEDRELDQYVVDVTIPTLVAKTALEYRWIRWIGRSCATSFGRTNTSTRYTFRSRV